MWQWDNYYVDNTVKVRDHCHITEKYGGCAHRDCNINVKLNHKISAVFHSLKDYDLHLIMQEIGKLNLAINATPNGLKKYMSFAINNKLSYIDSFQFLSYLLDNIVKNLSKDDFKYLRQEFDNSVLDLMKQKRFYPHNYVRDFEKFKEELLSKEKFYSSLTSTNIIDKKIWTCS